MTTVMSDQQILLDLEQERIAVERQKRQGKLDKARAKQIATLRASLADAQKDYRGATENLRRCQASVNDWRKKENTLTSAVVMARGVRGAARRKVEAARQGLRDMGVNVDE